MPKKAEKKQQEKVIEDLTFGLKNKNKSKVVQKYIKGVEHTVKHKGESIAKIESEEFERKKNKKKEEQEQALLETMFRTVKQEAHDSDSDDFDSSDDDADPKTRVCPYFKQGLCNKGKNCKYSHDLSIKKGKDMDLHIDQRTQLLMNGEDDVYFDEDKLLKLIDEKSRSYNKQKPTEIVCKFFIEAVEKKKYNWSWMCPNGLTCHYRHCLPPGYSIRTVLKKKEVSGLAVEAEIDMLREEMSAGTGTPVTLERFMRWKEEKRLRRQEEEAAVRKEEEKKARHGKQHMLSGKALFEFDASLFVDDEEAVEDKKIYAIREEEEEDETEAVPDSEDEERKEAE
ncbi:uncharacterized protein LOC127595012 [Hippocampus zosterae]|uniref:uncharacterized protein LOC127595012 n=1 Tax=Hippocampus zosterae TaxID=109293 RepID=UPI00223E2622|nr:uncharacterized protein LOC127595012 [Hippocampus zosterae]